MKITIDKKGILTFIPFVAIAVLFWVSTFMTKKADYAKDIAIKIIAPKDEILLDTDMYNANIHLTGKGLDLIFINSFNKHNPLQIHLKPGEKHISKEKIFRALQKQIANPGITVKEVEFAGLTLNIENKTSKKVKIIHRGNISYDKFYGPKDTPHLTPGFAEISGPQSIVDTMRFWYTERKDFTGLNTTVEEWLKLENSPDPKIDIHPGKCKITIPVEPYTEKKLSIPVHVSGSRDKNISVVPARVTVSFLVGLSKYDSIDSTYFHAAIYFDKDEKTERNFPVSIIKKPKDVKILFIQPSYVDIIYKTHRL